MTVNSRLHRLCIRHQTMYRSTIIFFLVLLFFNTTANRVGLTDVSYQSYNSQGEVTQFEYAVKSINQAPAVVCYAEKDRFVLLACHSKISPLLSNKQQLMRFVRHQGNVVALPVGYLPDCKAMSVQLNYEISRFSLQYGSAPSVKYLATRLADWSVRGLFPSDETEIQRPYAAAMILCSPSCIPKQLKETLEPAFTFVGNTGAVQKQSSVILGRLSEESRKQIEEIIRSKPVSQDDVESASIRRKKILACLSGEYEHYEQCLVDFKKQTIEISDITSLKEQEIMT